MEEYSEEIIISLAAFLCPRDILSMALTCKRFGARGSSPSSRAVRQLATEGARAAKRQKIEERKWSSMEEAARQVIETSASDAERCALPRRGDESWMSIYHELLLLRAPRQFDQILGASSLLQTGD